MSTDAGPNHLMLDGPFTDAGLAAVAGLDGLFGLSFFWHIGPELTPAGLDDAVGITGLSGRTGAHRPS